LGEVSEETTYFDIRVLQADNERWPKVEMKPSNKVQCASQMIPSVSHDINL
jgi:hypothetical protein